MCERTYWCFTLFNISFCRDTDGAIVRPLPKCKRMLSDQVCLPHISQVWLYHLLYSLIDARNLIGRFDSDPEKVNLTARSINTESWQVSKNICTGNSNRGFSRLAPGPTAGSGHNCLSAEKKLTLYGFPL